MHSSAFAAPRSEINITPLVDVTLVLLIIFMVIAPLQEVQFPVTAPRTSRASAARRLVTVSLDANGALALNGAPVLWNDLAPRLSELFALGAERQVLFDGADGATHREAVDVMDRIRSVQGSVSITLAEEEPANGRHLP